MNDVPLFFILIVIFGPMLVILRLIAAAPGSNRLKMWLNSPATGWSAPPYWVIFTFAGIANLRHLFETEPCYEDSHILTAAHNAPPEPFVCSGTHECQAACGKLAVHAEERALSQWIGPRFPDVLHIRVVNGEPVPSGEPCCITCSRTMLLHKVAGVWLWHEDGWRRYNAVEFHTLSLQHPKHRLPVFTSVEVLRG